VTQLYAVQKNKKHENLLQLIPYNNGMISALSSIYTPACNGFKFRAAPNNLDRHIVSISERQGYNFDNN